MRSKPGEQYVNKLLKTFTRCQTPYPLRESMIFLVNINYNIYVPHVCLCFGYLRAGCLGNFVNRPTKLLPENTLFVAQSVAVLVSEDYFMAKT